MKIERIDHLNITVADMDRSIAFYKKVLGMDAEMIGEGRAALNFGQQKIHLDLAGTGMTMRAEPRMPAHICFVTQAPVSEIKAHLAECGVEVRMEGPRAGAIGTIQSVYIDDPDRNSVEIFDVLTMAETPERGETQIIEAAFEDRVRDIFKTFAEAIYVGEPERDAAVRFRRGLVSARRARAAALEAAKEE